MPSIYQVLTYDIIKKLWRPQAKVIQIYKNKNFRNAEKFGHQCRICKRLKLREGCFTDFQAIERTAIATVKMKALLAVQGLD
jgi:hypothetical protein